MKILVAGMGSCGSTMLCNIIRLILLHNNFSVQVSLAHNFRDSNADIKIVKLHDYDPKWHEWADVIFTARRDLRDAIISNRRRFPQLFTSLDSFISKCNEEIVSHQGWIKYTNYEFVYEQHMQIPTMSILHIYNYLLDIFPTHLKCDVELIKQEIVALKEEKAFGENTNHLLMSPQHIGDGKIGKYKDILTKEELDAINKHFDWWLKQYGYADNN